MSKLLKDTNIVNATVVLKMPLFCVLFVISNFFWIYLVIIV